MTSEVKADLKIELSDLNYLCSNASLACKGFPEMIATDQRGHCGLQKTSEVKADLKIELSDLNYLYSHASLACKDFLEMIATTTGPIMIHRPACFAPGKKSEPKNISSQAFKT